MKNRFLFVFLLFQLHLAGQNNYIYNGSGESGFSFNTIHAVSNNSIFEGNTNTGFNKYFYSKFDQNWIGGIDDGFCQRFFGTLSNNLVYNGSFEDGMDFQTFNQVSENPLHNGGAEDGFDYGHYLSIPSLLTFEGGEGDGFSASGISKLIWDGDLNTDWLMADNWNIPIVPTISHAVCIPSGVPNYPKLSSLLGISFLGTHTYACSDLEIFSDAHVKGIDDIYIIVNSNLIVHGQLLLKTSNKPKIEAKSKGLIEIKNGGVIRMDN